MKLFTTSVIILFWVMSASSQTINTNYDSTLAKSYGADDYGMKMYFLVILKTGTGTIAEKEIKDSLFAGHMKNINRMVELKKLVVAGPMGKNDKTYRGIFILDVISIDEANQLLDSDPAIKAKLLEPEIYKWYGSAALPAYLETADKIWKKNP